MSDSVQPHRWQPTRLSRPWDSPGKNTGVGRHFLLQCMKAKSESEVAQLCPTLSGPMDCSLPGSSVHGIFQARVLEISGWRSVHQPREPKGRNTFRKLINSGAKRHKTRETHCILLGDGGHQDTLVSFQAPKTKAPDVSLWKEYTNYQHKRKCTFL